MKALWISNLGDTSVLMQIRHFSIEEDRFYMVTDDLSLRLATVVRHHGHHLSEGFCAFTLGRVVKALAQLHSQHVVHTSVTADSVFLGMNCDVRLGNFTDALILTKEQPHGTGPPCNNWEAAPPETKNGARRFDTQADVWQLGLLALHMLHGQTVDLNSKPWS